MIRESHISMSLVGSTAVVVEGAVAIGEIATNVESTIMDGDEFIGEVVEEATAVVEEVPGPSQKMKPLEVAVTPISSVWAENVPLDLRGGARLIPMDLSTGSSSGGPSRPQSGPVTMPKRIPNQIKVCTCQFISCYHIKMFQFFSPPFRVVAGRSLVGRLIPMLSNVRAAVMFSRWPLGVQQLTTILQRWSPMVARMAHRRRST